MLEDRLVTEEESQVVTTLECGLVLSCIGGNKLIVSLETLYVSTSVGSRGIRRLVDSLTGIIETVH